MASASPIAAGCSSHSRVLPWMSVRRNVERTGSTGHGAAVGAGGRDRSGITPQPARCRSTNRPIRPSASSSCSNEVA